MRRVTRTDDVPEDCVLKFEDGVWFVVEEGDVVGPDDQLYAAYFAPRS